MRLRRSLILAGAIILPLLIGASAPQFASELRTLSISFLRPLLEIQNQIVGFARKEVNHLVEWPKLRRENEALRSEIRELKHELRETEEMKRELPRLQDLLRLKQKSGKGSLAARVIARDPSHWSQFIVINKGSRDGVSKNTVLIHPDGLVGKVAAGGLHSARAILLIDSESRAGAMNERTRDAGVVEGMGSFVLKMTYLDRASDIQVGDVIISSGLGGIYPKAIPIGKVILVGSEGNRLTPYALVKPFVSFSKLEEVLCVSSQTDASF